MKYIKLYENIDLDPYDEEDWEEKDKEYDVYIEKPGLVLWREKGKENFGWNCNYKEYSDYIIGKNPGRSNDIKNNRTFYCGLLIGMMIEGEGDKR